MPTDPELIREKVKNTPKPVFLALYLSVALGLLLGTRAILMSISVGRSPGKSILFALIQFAFFTFNGLSLLTRSRWGYMLIAIFALLPLLGSLAGSLHLLALLTTGRIAVNLSETVASVLAVLQLVVIVTLFISLLSSATRSYVWSSSEEAGSKKAT